MRLDVNTNEIWQIGSGNESRDYCQLCLDYGIAIAGDGDVLKNKVKENHWIILRKGRKIIKAVGKVSSKYLTSKFLSDVEGWDLRHLRYVDWYVPIEGEISFDKSILSMSTIERCPNENVKEKIINNQFTNVSPTHKFEDINLPEEITLNNLTTSLIDHGIRIQDSENISTTIRRIIDLAKWYQRNDKYAKEHEIRTFLVIPLIIALGWSEQKIKIEYNKIDIAIFKKSFTGNYKDTPYIIVETKTFEDGLSFTKEQLSRYTDNYPTCKYAVATNGIRYKFYDIESNQYIERSYLNLNNLRERHLQYPEINGGIQCLIDMSNLGIE